MAHLVCLRILDKSAPLHLSNIELAELDNSVSAQDDVFVVSP